MMKSDLTLDTFFNGKLTVKQARSGYRYSIDAVLLAHNVRPNLGDRVVDLGTGCGIIPLIVAHRNTGVHIYGIEIQRELADLASINVRENGLEDHIQVFCKDMQTIQLPMFQGPVDMVVSNPPFRRISSGRINPNQQRAVARHEIKVQLQDVVSTAGRILKTGGRFILIYTSERLTDLIVALRSCHVEPKWLRLIHSSEDSESKLLILEGIKNGRPGLKIDKPLVIYNPDGSYTAEVETMFN